MAITRREFMFAAGAALATGVVAGQVGAQSLSQGAVDDTLFAVPAGSANDPLSYLTKDHFAPFVGTPFRMRTPAGRLMSFNLVSVDEYSSKKESAKGYPASGYSLLFEARRGLADGVYTADHANLGTFSLFVVGVGPAGSKYEAIVNRLTKSAG